MNAFFIEPICNDYVGLEIRHLDPKKAPGPDCIGGKLIQLCPAIFSNNLTKISNWAIQTGVYPHAMKLVRALYKKVQGMIPTIITQLAMCNVLRKPFRKSLLISYKILSKFGVRGTRVSKGNIKENNGVWVAWLAR